MATVTSSSKYTSSSTQAAGSGIPGTPTPLTVGQEMNCNFTTSGTAADSVDLNYVKTLTLAASATTIDLTSLTDRYGNAVNFARVRKISIRNKSATNGQNLTVSGGASNPWAAIWGATGSVIVFPSTATNAGFFVITAPGTTAAAVSGTSKTIKLDPGANTFDVEIEIEGASA